MTEDRDRQSRDEAERLVESAAEAARPLATFSQEKIDAIVGAMSRAALDDSYRLGEMAHLETGFGSPSDKALKNRFSAETVYNFIRPMRTVGIVRETNSVIEVASPRGVVAAIIPSTNPTSTAIFKILIAIKARDAIVLSPHPSATNCINETVRVMIQAAEAAGLPKNAIGCMSVATIEGTQALMKHKLTALILATGGIGLVRAAYSSGKPAFGVGPGNVPAMIERSASVTKAVKDILTGKCFDNGTICSSEQAVIVERAVEPETRAAFLKEGGYFLNEEEQERLSRVAVTPENKLNTKIVGKSARAIAEMAGIKLPDGVRAMLARLDTVGKDAPLSMEKLSPILAYYVVDGIEQGCERAAAILKYGGMGHTASIHTRDRSAAKEYGVRMPASRVVVNSPSTHGAIGFTTDLEPSMTLGCGSWGGNVTSDNISPRHLLDLKRIAFETHPINQDASKEQAAISTLPAPKHEIDRATIASLVDRFLTERDINRRNREPRAVPSQPGPSQEKQSPAIQPAAAQARPEPLTQPPSQMNGSVRDFVCEDDVKRALAEGHKIFINNKTIITPAARDLGEPREVFARQQ
ncbi:MAG TPA: aldehyde dehydrogenase family protein [Blastocatellia bacterium]|nr:aldehyde dehydrogenase family protein [Blastocatellia bacterium]